MDPDQLLAPEEGPALAPRRGSRGDVLEMLRAADQPLGVREVAQRTGLHPNTARFHLEALVNSGLATRETQDRETPGRPRVGYRATTRATTSGQRRYRLLSQMLATLIAVAVPEPGAAAEEAGHEWGEYLTEQPPPYRRPDAEEALAKLTSTLGELGFSPDLVSDGDGGRYRVNLRQCPFREVAQQHRQVICALHLGLMRGALSRMRAPVTADRLDPFVEPGLCVARLSASALPGLRVAGQQFGQHRRLADGKLLGRRQQRHWAAGRARTQPRERLALPGRGEFRDVAAPEFGEPGRVVTVPGPQFRRRRDILRPLIQPRRVLAEPARPDPVNQHPGAVVGRRRVVDPADPDPRAGSSGHDAPSRDCATACLVLILPAPSSPHPGHAVTYAG
jgi:predicted ArsR family transcriptional regulator